MEPLIRKLLVWLFFLPLPSYSFNEVSAKAGDSAILIQEEISRDQEGRVPEISSSTTPLEVLVPLEILDEKEGSEALQDSNSKEAALESRYLRLVRSLRERLPIKLGSLLEKIGAPRDLTQKIVQRLTFKIDRASNSIEKSNALGFRLQGHIVMGIGLSDDFMKAMKASRHGKWIPKRGGFGLSMAAGFTVLRVRGPTGSKVIIRLHSDLEKVDKILSLMAEGFAGLHGMTVAESVAQKVKLFEKSHYRGTNLGAMGKMLISPRQFEYGVTPGISIPPIIAATYLYETKGTQYRINFQLSTDWIHKMMETTKSVCRFFF